MPTFPRGHYAYLVRRHNTRVIAKLEPEPQPQHHTNRGFEFPDPVDLRGIPVIGRGIRGAVTIHPDERA